MEITILEKEENSILIKISGETHTFLNLLTDVLQRNKHVDIASYQIKHVSISDPVLFIKTDGADPIKVLKESIKELISDCDEFIEVFRKSVRDS